MAAGEHHTKKSGIRTKAGLLFLSILVALTWIKNGHRKEKIYYLPFNIPGTQMAATVPPYGIFIEPAFRNNSPISRSLLNHERAHWKQYCQRGLARFYLDYFSGLLRFGRLHNPMEQDARAQAKRMLKPGT